MKSKCVTDNRSTTQSVSEQATRAVNREIMTELFCARGV